MLVRADGATASSTSFGSSGDATYTLSLWPGIYDARFSANQALCVQGASAPAVPCVGGLVHAGAALQSDGVLDVDILPVKVSGKVTLLGAALPTEAVDRGSISFARTATEGGSAATFTLGTSASVTYSLTVTAGNYLVSHVANSALCGSGRPLPGVPCSSQVIIGCAK